MWHIPLKEGELAVQSGLTRETVDRVIRDLKTEGMVAVSAAEITVLDIAKLKGGLGMYL